MSRPLVLAYFFPPLGGPGTQRSAKLVRDLPALGHEPVVVTGPGVSSGCWDPEDRTLLGDIPRSTRVVRAGGTPPGALDRLGRLLDRTSPFSRWWIDAAVAAARPLLDDVDVIYAAMAPYETAFAAATLAMESGLPWVADLRDPWALDEMQIYPSGLHRRRNLQRMRSVLASAHAIIMNTPEAANALRHAFPELGMKLIRSVPNGYDARDFALRAPGAIGRDDDAFRIVHCGSLHTAAGLEHARQRGARRMLGGSEPVDVLARSHVHLVAALEELQRADPALAARVELHLAGVVTDVDREVASSVHTVVHGYLDHDRSVELVRSADLLFLPMHDLPTGRRARIVPGKTYEYVASGRPILAAVPDGDARDLLLQVPGAHVHRPTDVAGLRGAIRDELWHTREHGHRPDAVAPIAAAYDRRRTAAAIGDVFDRVIAREPATSPANRLRLVV